MELPTPRTAVAMQWFLLLCLGTSGVLQALAQSTSGFISIDCGHPGETGYVNALTSVWYTPDAGFIDANAGSNHNVDAKYIYSKRPIMWWYTVRSFPGAIGTRNCYTLGPLVAGQKYLIRAKFEYGNYDGLDKSHNFDLYIGVDFWTTVNITVFYITSVAAEVILVVPQDSVKVCLVNTGNGVPFISLLELRPLKSTLYPLVTATQSLVLVNRLHFGYGFWYPEDPYDRIWYSFSIPTSPALPVFISTKKKVQIDDDDQFQPPQGVMQEAMTTRNVSDDIEFNIRLQSSPRARSLGYIHTFYFCELEQLTSSETREYRISLNGRFLTLYTPPYLVEGYVTSNVPFQASEYVVSLKSFRSTKPPLINAFELFDLIPITVGTDSLDASYITAIKATHQVEKNWMGDPCLPTTLVWQGLNCTYAGTKSPIISRVDVSSSGLRGAISPDFGNLKNVKYLDLSRNFFGGSIPDALSQLPSLVFLDLSYNRLTGTIPSGLLQKVQAGSLDLRYRGNPGLCSDTSCKGKKKLDIRIVVPVVVIVTLVVLAILYFLLRRGRKQGSIKNSIEPTNEGNGNVSLEEKRQFSGGNISLELENRQFDDGNISLELENRQFTYLELEKITNNFQRQLGRGGFGYVFYGSLDNGTEVAVKLSSHSSDQDVKQFLAEAQVLARIHHKNLVYMIGFCTDREHMALVYEYMPQGTLQEHIAGEGGSEQGLSWRQRLRIALESAQGLQYLHKGCSPPIIHRDVKTANILSNAKLEVKIADFGLSKAYKCEDDTHLTTKIFAGTQGYVDPEYMRTMQPSTKSDVYSFGVVLLELVTGKPAVMRHPEPITIIEWSRQRLAQGDIEGVVDARMHGDYDINAVWKSTEIALKCTERSPLQRPSMTDIVMQLQECLDLEESYMEGDSYTGSGIGGMSPNMGYNPTSQSSAALR